MIEVFLCGGYLPWSSLSSPYQIFEHVCLKKELPPELALVEPEPGNRLVLVLPPRFFFCTDSFVTVIAQSNTSSVVVSLILPIPGRQSTMSFKASRRF
jgi:hypothetical protein